MRCPKAKVQGEREGGSGGVGREKEGGRGSQEREAWLREQEKVED